MYDDLGRRGAITVDGSTDLCGAALLCQYLLITTPKKKDGWIDG